MDPISGSNPTNNPRLDLLHNNGGNQQLNGAAGSLSSTSGSYTPPQAPAAPTGGAPQSASAYVAAAQASRQPSPANPAPAPTSIPQPRPAAPMYASVGGGGGEEGGVGIAGIVIGIVALLLITGGMYFMFSSQLNSQNKKLESTLNEMKTGGIGDNADLKTHTIENEDKISTKTIEVTENGDEVDGLTVNGSSNLQGPVKVGQDLTVGGNLDVSGSVTAAEFIGDGSKLTGVAQASGGAAGPAGPRGATGPAGAPNPNAIRANTAGYADNAGHANQADNATTLGGMGAGNFVQLQSDASTTVQDGNINISGNFRSMATLANLSLTATPGQVTPNSGENVLDSNTNHFFKVVAMSGTSVVSESPTVKCTTGSTQNKCDLAWTGPTLGVTSYIVYRADPNTTNFNAYRTLSIPSSSYAYRNVDGESTSNPIPGVKVPLKTAKIGGGSGTNYVLGSFGVNTTDPDTSFALDVNGDLKVTDVIASGDVVGKLFAFDAGTDGDTHTSLQYFDDGTLILVGGGTSSIALKPNGDVDASGQLKGASLSISGAATVGGQNVCTAGANCTSTYAPASGSSNYIRAAYANQTASFWINGEGRMGLLNTTDANIGNIAGGGSGKLGINTGIGGASEALHVVGNIKASGTLVVANGTAGINGRMRAIGDTLVSAAELYTDQNFHALNMEATGSIWADNYFTPGADYAEMFTAGEAMSAGDVVALTAGGKVVKSSWENQNTVIGVVSTKPGVVIGKDKGNTPIAEVGRVPVKVSSEGGAIEVGDYLTSSNTPGVAKKASPGMKTIGLAMEPLNGSSGTIEVYVSVSNGGVGAPVSGAASEANASGETAQLTEAPAQGTAKFANLNVSGTSTFENIKVTGLAEVANLTVTGLAKVQDIQVNGHIVGNADTRGTLVVPAGAASATHAFATVYGAKPVVVASPVTASVPYKVAATASGFTITLDTPAAQAVEFSYLVQQ